MNLFDVCFLILKRKTKLRLGFFGITAKKVFIHPKHPSALWDLLDSNYIAMFGLTKVIAKYFSIKQPGAFAHEILRLVLFCFFSFAHNRVASPASPLSLGSDAPLLPLTFGFDRITTHRSGPLPTGGLFGGRDSPLATPCGGGELRSAAGPRAARCAAIAHNAQMEISVSAASSSRRLSLFFWKLQPLWA